MTNARQPAAPALTGFHELKGGALAIAIAGIMLGLLVTSLNQTIVGTAMPRIVSDLGGLEQYAWVVTVYLLTSTAAVPIFGKLSDIYGRKWFYIGGLILFMIAAALCGASQTMFQLILFRGLQGIAGGIVMTNTFALIGDLFPPAERGKWQGLTGSVFGLASVVGPTLGGWLTDGPGWRWVFYVNIPVGLLAVAVLVIGLPQIRTHEAKPIDWLGATAIVAAVVPLLLAFTWAGTEYPWGSIQIVGMLLVATVMTGLFLLIEHRAADPIIPLSLFQDRTFTVSVVAMFLLASGMFGAIMYIPLFAQTVLGASATSSGVILTPMMLSLVVASAASGQIISRTGRYKWSPVSGLTIMAVGMWLLSQMGTGTSLVQAGLSMIVVGTGIGMTMPTLTLAVQNAFPPSVLGVVTASVQFFRSIGATIGVALMGTFLSTQLATGLARDLPTEVRAAIPPGIMAEISPQALASPEAEAALEAQFAQLPNGAALFDRLIEAMQASLSDAVHEVFVLAFIIAVVAVIVSVFLPEIPLRKRNAEDPAEQVGKTLSAEQATAGHPTGATQPRLLRPAKARKD